MMTGLLLAALLEAGTVDLLVRGGIVVTMDAQERVLHGGAVAIRGETIQAVLAAGEPLPKARETIDARGHLVIPGLVNVHGHVPMVLMRGLADDLPLLDWLHKVVFPAEAQHVTPSYVYQGTLLACLEMARSGTTTFADMYYFEDDIAQATDKAGLRAVLGQTLIGFPAPDYKTADAALIGTEQFLKRWRGHPRITPSVAPHALYTTPLDLVRKARELSRRYSVPFQIHAHESPDEDRLVRETLGATAVTVLESAGLLGPDVLLHHAITLTDDDLLVMARRGVAVSHNLESNMKVAAGPARLPEMLAAGLAVGLGTDGAASNNNLDLFEEMDSVAKVHKLFRHDPTLLPARDVFRLATRGGARALGLGDRIGALEKGRLADVVLVEATGPEATPLYDVYSALVYSLKGGAVRTVVVGGRVVLRDRRMLTLDAEEVRKQAWEIAKRLKPGVEAP
jgi:5-methylthioadenosine/S-adenosylhomocysteine deaminase